MLFWKSAAVGRREVIGLKKEYKAVIFDLDGTLLNTLDDLADSCNYVLAGKGLRTYPVEQYRGFVGSGAAILMRRIHPEGTPQAELDDSLTKFSEYYSAHKDVKTAPYPGIADLLKRLRAAGIRLCVLSNKPHEISVQIVKQYFGEDTFDMILGKSPAFPVKPDPASCLYILSELGLDRGGVLYVGDSNVDIRTAKNAGLTGCGVCWGFRSEEELRAEGADYLAHTPDDIFLLATGDA